jgi:hypothetical protein
VTMKFSNIRICFEVNEHKLISFVKSKSEVVPSSRVSHGRERRRGRGMKRRREGEDWQRRKRQRKRERKWR